MRYRSHKPPLAIAIRPGKLRVDETLRRQGRSVFRQELLYRARAGLLGTNMQYDPVYPRYCCAALHSPALV